MAKGTVKWFNATKGYGFIAPEGGGNDVFVHISAVERAGMSTLNPIGPQPRIPTFSSVFILCPSRLGSRSTAIKGPLLCHC